MTVDISALSWMIRRMDVSATLKTFTASFAFLTVLINLGGIYAFVMGVLQYDLYLEESGSLLWFVAGIGVLVVSAFTPLAFLLWDWIARRPWRYLAAVNGAVLGAAAAATVSGLVASSMWIAVEEFVDWSYLERGTLIVVPVALLAILTTWMVAGQEKLRSAMKWIVVGLAASLLIAFLAVYVDELREGGPGALRDGLLGLLGTGASVVLITWLLVRTVRHRIILSGNRPRELFLGALHRQGFWVRLAFLTGLPSSLWNPAAVRTLAFWAFLLARPLVYGGVLLFAGAAAPGEPAGQVVLAAALIVGGHLLFYGAKRLAARYAWHPGKRRDSLAPVLFLRSFEDDQLRFRRPWWQLLARWFDLWSFRRNADEAMIDEIAQYGPVVALGMPGETKVPFGARRFYSSHDDWQEIVTTTAKNAQAIVIVAGDSPGIQWEYELLAHENLLGKTLLLLPANGVEPGRYNAALRAFAEIVGIAGHYRIPDGQEAIALLPGKDHAPVLLTARKAAASAYVAAIRGYFQRCTVDELADPLTL